MIKYVMGDATKHKNGVLVHCCNDIGAAGAGIIVAIMNKYPEAIKKYRQWSKTNISSPIDKYPFQLGYIQNVKVTPKLWVCNLIGQRSIMTFYGLPPVRYESIHEGLLRLRRFMLDNKITELVSGRMGAGLAGGDWNIIESIIEEVFTNTNIQVTIYDIEEWPNTIYEESVNA